MGEKDPVVGVEFGVNLCPGGPAQRLSVTKLRKCAILVTKNRSNATSFTQGFQISLVPAITAHSNVHILVRLIRTLFLDSRYLRRERKKRVIRLCAACHSANQ